MNFFPNEQSQKSSLAIRTALTARMASSMVGKTLRTLHSNVLRTLTSNRRQLSLSGNSELAFSSDDPDQLKPASNPITDDDIYIKGPDKAPPSSASVSMPISSMTGSIVGKRFYKKVTTREADDGNGWHVMLDYRTLKTPSKRNLKCPTLALAKAIAAEWEYQVH